MFHIFRNSPLGRENLLQSIYFCQQVGGVPLSVFIPEHTQCVMYLENTVVTLGLDSSYVAHPETAAGHLREQMEGTGIAHEQFIPSSFTAGSLPEIPSHWQAMACPRVISEDASRMQLGHIGPKVRAIVKHAPFPVFIASPSHKPWNQIVAFYGGSGLGICAVRQALRLANRAHLPLTLLTQLNGTQREACLQGIKDAGLEREICQPDRSWRLFETGALEENLYHVPSDALVVIGAAGHSLMHELVFGSKLELVQKMLPNPILVVGPHSKPL